jgi:hypothetical protein
MKEAFGAKWKEVRGRYLFVPFTKYFFRKLNGGVTKKEKIDETKE